MSLSAKRILCVEDHADTCELLRFLLFDYEVLTVGTIAEALEVARTGRVDLYVLDTRLPDGTALELCQRIRVSDLRTPILFCSADTIEATRQQALQAGAQAYLTKPCEPEVLRQTVARLLKGEEEAFTHTG